MRKHKRNKRVDTYEVKKNSGCHGTTTYLRTSGPPVHGCAQPSPMSPHAALGRDFGPGTVVRVTVEVLTEYPPVEGECENPWKGHRCPAE